MKCWSRRLHESRSAARREQPMHKPEDPSTQRSESSAARLPVRWGVIFLASCLAAIMVNSVAGPAANGLALKPGVVLLPFCGA